MPILFRRYIILSFFTGTFNGAPRSFQLGINSSSALGWKTLPERIWAPISEPFSSKHIEKFVLFFLFSWANCIAVARPDGPPPTITTSYSISSLCIRLVIVIVFKNTL